MDIYRSKFGRRLRDARKKVPGLSQEKLADLVGVEGASVSRWETGKDFPEGSRLPKICEALGVPADYFEQPENVIRKDPLPEWASSISANLAALQKLIPQKQESIPPALWAAWNEAEKEKWRQQIAMFFLTGDPDHLERDVPEELKKRLFSGLNFHKMNPSRKKPAPSK